MVFVRTIDYTVNTVADPESPGGTKTKMQAPPNYLANLRNFGREGRASLRPLGSANCEFYEYLNSLKMQCSNLLIDNIFWTVKCKLKIVR